MWTNVDYVFNTVSRLYKIESLTTRFCRLEKFEAAGTKALTTVRACVDVVKGRAELCANGTKSRLKKFTGLNKA